jgi:hypothetical protein
VCLTFLVYLTFRTRNYYWDGIAFAQTIENAQDLNSSLLHPNHLIYTVVGYLFYKSLLFFTAVRAIDALQIMNCALSALCALVMFQILRSLLHSLYLASALTLLFAFSATWWKFSTDANAYIPAVLFELISFYLIMPPRRPKPLLVAFTLSTSMLFHQLAILFLPVAVLGLFLQTRSLTPLRRALLVLQLGATCFAITVAAYCYGEYLTTRSLGPMGFVRWFTSHSPDASFSYSLWNNFLFTLRGDSRLFFGGRFNSIKGLISAPITILLGILVVLFLFLGFSLAQSYRSFAWREDSKQFVLRNRSLMLLCIVWIITYHIFLFFWLPFNGFYRLFYLPALIIVVGLVISCLSGETARQRTSYQVAVLVAVLALSNFLFFIFPYSHTQKYPPLAMALQMKESWPAGTIIYYSRLNSDNSLVHYFNPGTVWKPLDDTLTTPASDRELRRIYSQGYTVWLDASAIDQLSCSRDGQEWLSAHVVEASRHEIDDPAYHIKFVKVVSGEYKGGNLSLLSQDH